MPLTICKTCGKEVSQRAKFCPHCGEPKNTHVNSAGALIIFGLTAYFGWHYFGPGIGSYELKEGYVACASEDDVVRYRGAGLLGMLSKAIVLADADCVMGPAPVKVTRLARGGRLIHHVTLDGRKLYADRDAIEKK